uniref:Ribosomal protein S16 n=1 Tax=Papuacedrus papuana TaxID=103977 RepID=A0A8F8SW12_9CONI|nr:ribosomal protein S16 [Papuacedrus papuana]
MIKICLKRCDKKQLRIRMKRVSFRVLLFLFSKLGAQATETVHGIFLQIETRFLKFFFFLRGGAKIMRLRLAFDSIKFFYYINFVSWLFYYYPFIFLLLYVHFMYFVPVRSYIEKQIRNFFYPLFKKGRKKKD